MTDKRAPVQGWAAGIPWELHLEAYSAYCKRYGPQQALIEGGCRGGFHADELDRFIPGWRERISVLTEARTKASDAKASMVYWHERAMRAEAALQKAHCELSVEEVDPDDCRASVLKILSDAIHAAPGSTDSGEGK